MAVTLNETPAANRIHIGFYGKRNSGKSSLLNAFAGQEVAVVSGQAGTTTDPVNKPMEIHGLGACVLTDTAGFDDVGTLGRSRVEKTRKAAERTDIALLLCSGEELEEEMAWYNHFRENKTPVILVVNKADIGEAAERLCQTVKEQFGEESVLVSARDKTGLEDLKERMLRALPEDYAKRSITGELAAEGDVVLLVMPQDIQAPKGRLILPQVQTIRELLDKKCIVLSVTTDKLKWALDAMKMPPKLIITDSQAFAEVYKEKPAESALTSFSMLFAGQKGDMQYYIDSAKEIASLGGKSRVLIAECCTHAPLAEDIGRVKLPRLLRQRYGEAMQIDIVSGTDFPEELNGYDLIIQCGGCMFNRKYILSRIERARAQGVPMTNYGVALAFLNGILEQTVYIV